MTDDKSWGKPLGLFVICHRPLVIGHFAYELTCAKFRLHCARAG